MDVSPPQDIYQAHRMVMLAARDPLPLPDRLCQNCLLDPHIIHGATLTTTRPHQATLLFQLGRPTGPQGDSSNLILGASLRVLPPPGKTLGRIKPYNKLIHLFIQQPLTKHSLRVVSVCACAVGGVGGDGHKCEETCI